MQNQIDTLRQLNYELIKNLGLFRQRAGLSFGQRHTLYHINAHQGLSIQELAELLQVDHSTMSRNVKKLMQADLVETFQDDADKRRKMIALSAVSRQVLDEATESINLTISNALQSLDEDEIENVITNLRKYSKAWKGFVDNVLNSKTDKIWKRNIGADTGDIQNALSLAEYLPVIEEGTCVACTRGRCMRRIYYMRMSGTGNFILKTGGICYGDEEYYGVKINGGFPGNMENYGLPSILGIIYICDARNGSPIAIMDSVTISKWRTGAATAVAAKYLAPEGRVQLGVFGYGTQAEIQAKALSLVRPIEIIRVSGRNVRKSGIVFSQAAKRTRHTGNLLFRGRGCPVQQPYRNSHSGTQVLYPQRMDTAGMFHCRNRGGQSRKQELDPRLVASSVVVTDIRVQACRVGESQHAISQGLMGKESIYAEVGKSSQAGKCAPPPESIIIYDSTGTALQDISVGWRSLKS